MFGNWGVHYANGSLVFTRFPDGEFGLAVVIAHTGDFHHRSIRVRLVDNADTPKGMLRLAADPTDEYCSYYMGPTVCVLSTAEFMSLAAGVNIVKPTDDGVDFEMVLEMQREEWRGPYKP